MLPCSLGRSGRDEDSQLILSTAVFYEGRPQNGQAGVFGGRMDATQVSQWPGGDTAVLPCQLASWSRAQWRALLDYGGQMRKSLEEYPVLTFWNIWSNSLDLLQYRSKRHAPVLVRRFSPMPVWVIARPCHARRPIDLPHFLAM